MSTKNKGELRWVKLDEITVHPERNPRGIITEESVAELAVSVGESGILEPLICNEGEEGIELVAGYRRHLAAKLAKVVDDIPIHIRDEETREEDALAENFEGLRLGTTPLSQGRALQQLAKNKGLSQKQMVKRFGKSKKFIAERFRLMRLPEAVREVFATGKPKISTVPALEKIAKVSDVAAARMAMLAAASPAGEQQLKTAPERLFDHLCRELAKERGTVSCSDGPKLPRPPAEGELSVISIGGHHSAIDIDVLAISDERREELARRLEAVSENRRVHAYGDDLEVLIDEDDLDALRALGVLLEYEGEYYVTRYCFDSAAMLDRVEWILAAAETEEKEREEAEIQQAREDAKKRGDEVPDDVDPAQLRAEKAKEKRQKELAKAKKAKKRSRRGNLNLGVGLIKRRARKRSEKRSRELTRALALIVVDAEEHLAGLGPRLVYETWQVVDQKKLKNGNPSEKVTYLDPREASERLRKDIEAARTRDEILNVIGDALVAGIYSEESELPVSRRVAGYYGGLRYCQSGPVRRVIDEEASGVLPPEFEGELTRSKKRGYEGRRSLIAR
jgi:ParB/RepB/Spo0J family partition protein